MFFFPVVTYTTGKLLFSKCYCCTLNFFTKVFLFSWIILHINLPNDKERSGDPIILLVFVENLNAILWTYILNKIMYDVLFTNKCITIKNDDVRHNLLLVLILLCFIYMYALEHKYFVVGLGKVQINSLNYYYLIYKICLYDIILSAPCSDADCNCFDQPCSTYYADVCMDDAACRSNCGYNAFCCCKEPSKYKHMPKNLPDIFRNMNDVITRIQVRKDLPQ
jgi:hypothetical protein